MHFIKSWRSSSSVNFLLERQIWLNIWRWSWGSVKLDAVHSFSVSRIKITLAKQEKWLTCCCCIIMISIDQKLIIFWLKFLTIDWNGDLSIITIIFNQELRLSLAQLESAHSISNSCLLTVKSSLEPKPISNNLIKSSHDKCIETALVKFKILALWHFSWL